MAVAVYPSFDWLLAAECRHGTGECTVWESARKRRALILEDEMQMLVLDLVFAVEGPHAAPASAQAT
jgi:hypothetical protein